MCEPTQNWAALNRDDLDRSNYTVSADPRRAGGRTQYWFQLYPRKLGRLKERTRGDFNIIVIGDENLAHGYWTIPFRGVEGVLTERTLSTPLHKFGHVFSQAA